MGLVRCSLGVESFLHFVSYGMSHTDEETILFPPTYRFNRGSRTLDDYVWVKNKKSGVSECVYMCVSLYVCMCVCLYME